MEFLTSNFALLAGVGALIVLSAVAFFVAVALRRVVPTNEVHIVQSSKKTTSYGKDTGNGNTYFEWPASLPILGITKVVLPVSNFDVDLNSYEAYDEGRLPFNVDVKAFFRIAESDEAAKRVASFDELMGQLTAIVQGAVRTVLASNSIEEIMQGRGKFGTQFTEEVREQLKSWGVETVKNIELMDIRDAKDSYVIKNIMEKKKSLIESQSRVEVAQNRQNAQLAEIEAKRTTDLKSEEARQMVSLRQVEVDRQVKLENEKAVQQVREQQKTTKEKEMAVLEVDTVRNAEITKQQALIQAEQKRRQVTIDAEAAKEAQTLRAQGELEAQKRQAEGLQAIGTAKAEAEKALQLAPVQAQITLAKEIGDNKSYQQYLITVEQIKATQAVGTAQAKALEAAEIKVIANSGDVSSGINGFSDLFTSKGGTQIGAMLEGLGNTDIGQALVEKVVGPMEDKPKKGNGTAKYTNGSAGQA